MVNAGNSVERQSFSDKIKALEDSNKRLQKQVQFITENTAITLNEKIQIAEELERRNIELDALASMAQAIIQIQAPDEVMKITVSKLPHLIGVEYAGIYLWNEILEELSLSFSNNLDDELSRRVVTRKLGQGLIGMVAKSRKSFYTDDVSCLPLIDTNNASPTLVTGLKGFAAVPISTTDKLLGVLAVGSPNIWQCTPHRIDVLSILGNMLAAAIENARLYYDSQYQIKRQKLIYQLSSIVNSSLHLSEVYDTFTRTLKKVIRVDWAGINLIDTAKQKTNFVALTSEVGSIWEVGESIPLEGTGTGWVISNRKSIYEDNLENKRLFWTDEALLNHGLKTVIRLPFILNNRAFGCLIIASREPNDYSRDDQEMLEEIANRTAIAISNNILYEEVSNKKNELEIAFYDALRLWVQSWEGRYTYLRGHSDKVSFYARKIAQQMGLSETQVKNIEIAARLHDIGLVIIPDEILLHQDKISLSERVLMEQHPLAGADMLRLSPMFTDIAPLIYVHHERYDGHGFPRGLKKSEIPLEGYILALAEDYALMGMEMPSRKAFTNDNALDFIRKASGSRYNPRVVEALLKVVTG